MMKYQFKAKVKAAMELQDLANIYHQESGKYACKFGFQDNVGSRRKGEEYEIGIGEVYLYESTLSKCRFNTLARTLENNAYTLRGWLLEA